LDRGTLAKLPRNLLELLRKAPIDKQLEFLAFIVLGGVHFWHVRRASKYERLHLDHSGISYKSPLPDAFRSLQPDWSVQWSQVREVRIVVPKVMFHPNLAALEIDAGPVKKKLQALQWSAVDSEGKATEAGSVPWRESFFSGMGGSREMAKTLRAVEESDIVRYARQAGVKVTTGEGSVSGFALESHRHALVATVLALLLLGYAIVDIAISQESYAVDPPFVLFALGGAIAVLVGMLWLASAGVPRAETLGLSLLLGGMVGLALYPGLLRLNEATDSEGLRDCEYRLTAYVVFSPVNSQLPVLEFDKDGQYWRQFALGTTHKFELRKGGLGFYQVNMAPVYAKLREYYTSGK
jgi:multidrug transporter EmrE-like cation transporter